MKLIKKTDLVFAQDYLCDREGTALYLPELAYQANDIAEVIAVNAFIEANAAAIVAGVEGPIVYKTEAKKAPAFASMPMPETPLFDATRAAAKELALEFIETNNVVEMNKHLQRYDALAAWFADEYVKVVDGPPSYFTVDMLTLSATDVIGAVKKFNDPEISKLRDMLRFEGHPTR